MEKYIGDIYMITNINKDKLDYLKRYNLIIEDYLEACNYELAKSDAILYKIDGISYIEVENFHKTNLNSLDNNNILKHKVYDPYVGQLFVKNIRKIKVLKNIIK